MSTIRKQSIISSVIVYFGFALGLLNTYLFTRQGGFTAEQYGLTNTFIAVASIMYAVAGVGMPGYLNKFFPYYKSHLKDQQNDQMTWAVFLPSIGFLVVMILGFAFKHILIDKVFNNSPELLQYYYWTFPFGFGFTLFMVFEAYAWQNRKAVLSNFLKEVVFRFGVTILIVLTTFGVIKSFSTFISIYSFLYIVLVIFLLMYFKRANQLHFNFSVSHVTRRFYTKIVTLLRYVWGGGIVFTIASVFDGIVIVAVLPNGMKAAGVFYLAQNISSLIQAPQRAVISASVGPLSHAWKDKDYAKISRIYQRSSINQLLFSSAMFCLIWMSFEDGVHTFHLQESYLQAKWIFFYLGLARIIDMGTGVNAQVIGTSTYWRFEFISGLMLFAITIPLTFVLTRSMGVVGPGVANLVGFGIYNLVRYLFLWKKFRMQPFNFRTLLSLLTAAGCYFVAWTLFSHQTGFAWICARSAVFCLLFGTAVIFLGLSPDAKALIKIGMKRLRSGGER